MSAVKKGKKKTAEHKEKIGRNAKGKHWFTNGITNVFCYDSPIGFTSGRIFIKE